MATLLLIRHDEPELTGVFLGQRDSPLSTVGHDHAAKALAGIAVAITWSSPLSRASQTAAYVRSPARRELPGLREIGYGDWTAKSWADIEAEWPDLARRKSADWLRIAPPGGETWVEFLQRVSQAWTLIREGPQPAAVVAHLGVNSVLAHLIDGRDPLAFTQKYGEVIRVEYD